MNKVDKKLYITRRKDNTQLGEKIRKYHSLELFYRLEVFAVVAGSAGFTVAIVRPGHDSVETSLLVGRVFYQPHAAVWLQK